jgi:hypothetical protein
VPSSRQRRKQLQNLMGRIDPVRSSSVLLLVKIVSRLIIVIALASSSRSFAVEQPSDIPAWLRPNVGEGEGQIAEVILRGGASFTSKKCARAWSEIPATLPWTLRVPTK